MDTYSMRDAAEVLGTSVPRVQRAVEASRIEPERTARGRRLTEGHVRRLREHLGFAPAVDGFTREDLFVLAALNLRPLGLRSDRAVARAASISPTTASKSLDKLIGLGLVTKTQERLLEGRVVDGTVHRASRNEEWWKLVDEIRRVSLPTASTPQPPKRVPRWLWHHFWNTDPSRIVLPRDEQFVAARLLRTDDPQAHAWASTRLTSDAIGSVTKLRDVDAARRSWLQRLASEVA